MLDIEEDPEVEEESDLAEDDTEELLGELEDDLENNDEMSDILDKLEVPAETEDIIEQTLDEQNLDEYISDEDGLLELDMPEEEDEPAADLPEKDDEASAETDNDLLSEDDDDDPMAELKNISATTAQSGAEEFEKLKSLSKKIIDGESVDIGINIKSEIKELLDLIMETKKRVDEIGPSLATSNEHIPNVLSTLESVTETTEDATLDLMENADTLNNYYQEFIEEINDLEDLVHKKDTAAILKKIVKLEQELEQADSSGFKILHALEFQDITEQKLQKVISAVRDMGGRLGAILGFIKLKQEKDPASVDDASQDDIDKLLSDFGLD